MVLIDDGCVYVRSDAALRIARGLRFPWPMAYALIAVPRFIRDQSRQMQSDEIIWQAFEDIAWMLGIE